MDGWKIKNMHHKLQKIIFPQGERLQMHWGLFYRGDYRVPCHESNGIVISANQKTDFASYLNGFPLNKWRLYTNLISLLLGLDISGKFAVNLLGYSLEPNFPSRHEYSSTTFDLEGREKITLGFPPLDESCRQEFLAFEILSYSECTLYGGAFYGEYDDADANHVNLAIATTTFKKEEFIKRNVALIKKELLESDDETAGYLFMHVVDNGRTLSETDISGKNIYLHPNKNTGGSGGFARGMMEAMRQSPDATHVLLMDDDVIVLPESIRRTYVLLTLLKDGWRDAFVSGAMLEMEKMFLQYEDAGRLLDSGDWASVKKEMSVNEIKNILKINKEFPDKKNIYAAWWYCCVPMHAIRKNGLPMPFFLRVDDIEMWLRCRADVMTMTGVCIWHQGFYGRYNAVTDQYFAYRNLLITESAGTVSGIKIMDKIHREFRRLLLEFAYDGAELVLLAVEDFMKGPEFFEGCDGEDILRSYGRLNEKMQPFENFPDIEVNIDKVKKKRLRNPFVHFLYQLTYNGHKFFPESWLIRKPAVIEYSWSYQPAKQAFRRHLLAVNPRHLLAVNPAARTAHLRTIDRRRFRELYERYRNDISMMRRHGHGLREKWLEAAPRMRSEEFWRNYLAV